MITTRDMFFIDETSDYNAIDWDALDNMSAGQYDNETWYVLETWSLIERLRNEWDFLNRFQFESALGIIDALYNNRPLETIPPLNLDLDDIASIKVDLDIMAALDNGQLQLDGVKQFDWEKRYPFSVKTAKRLIEFWDKHNDISDNTDPTTIESHVNWFNNSILDLFDLDICHNYSFSDQLSHCDNCYENLFDISPTSYSWKANYYENSYGERLCEDCVNDDIESYFDEYMTDSMRRINEGDMPRSLPQLFDDFITKDNGWYEVINPSSSYNNTWEQGLHRGMNDSPIKQVQLLMDSYKHNGQALFQVVFRVFPSQFYAEWSVYFRINPDIDVDLDLDEFMNKAALDIGHMFTKYGTLGYDLASSMEKALKSATKNFVKIRVDENGDPDNIEYDSFEDMIKEKDE